MSFRILCIETNPISRLGLETTLLQPSLSPGGQPIPKFVGSLMEAYEHLHQEHVDVIVCDKNIEHLTAYEFADELRKSAPDLKFVLCAFVDSPMDIAQAVVHGFFEFIPRLSPANDLAESLSAISKGNRPNNSLVKRFAEYMTKLDWPTMRLGREDDSTELTRREMQIIALLALGLNNHDIGALLKIRLDTTKEHVQNILRKLELPDRTAVAVWALKNAATALQIPKVPTYSPLPKSPQKEELKKQPTEEPKKEKRKTLK